MAGKRRVLGAAFKARVALAAAKGDRTTAHLASQFGIHTSQVTARKMEVEWLKKSCRGRLRSSGSASTQTTSSGGP